MRRKEYQIHVLEKLAGLEDATRDLYKAYAYGLADFERFWLGLAADEETHAGWIRELKPLVGSGSLDFDESRFLTRTISNFTDYVNEEWATAQGRAMPLIRAVSIALDIERAFLEKRLFEVAEGDSLELERVLSKLAVATQEHRDMLHKVWSKHRELHH
jgi:hypothetical protein